MMTAEDVLNSGWNEELAITVIGAYKEIEQNYVFGKWKPSELDAGHFVEAVRRIIDMELTGSYKSLNKPLAPFNDNELKRYEQLSGNQSYRLLIPRALKSIYNLRNKRGVAHISDVSPNEMDATIILYTVKWILAELVRLKSGLSTEETQRIIDDVVERKSSIIWKHGDITSVLDPNLKAREQVLVLLYDTSPQQSVELQAIIEYNNTTNFMKILKRLHASKLIYLRANGDCFVTPVGIPEAENILARRV